jgi:hypothetical protein
MSVTELTTEIDKLTADFQNSFGDISTEQLKWNNNRKCWSVAQNISHLIVINQSYNPILEQLNSGTLNLPFMAKIKFMVKLFGKLILSSVEPSRQKKIKTFSLWEPTSLPHAEHLLSAFVAQQEQLKKNIIANEHSFHKIIHSPANKNIVYTLGKAFEILVVHERRHFNQAIEILALGKDKC